MFSPEQEVQLGEVLTKIVKSHAGEMDQPALTAYLQKLADRLVQHLPPTGLQFRFYLSSLPVANAFSIAGGRVYVTKKLIGYAHSEDELVGVLAHELGHIVTHQTAIDYTRFFKTIGVTEVKDGDDIEAKFHRLLESGKRFEVREEDRQMEADRVGLELTALAGYKPEALADFYDRITNNQGKTGTWFTDLFGVTTKSSKRLREMEKTLRQFPAGCAQTASQSAQEFHAWQSKVVVNSGTGRTESVPGLLAKKALDPPLQDEVHTLRFSYDGKYLAETTVIKELIPYIDKNYRTIASSGGRSLQGMSMGGFGATRLAFKYTDLFSSVVAFAGGYRRPEEMDVPPHPSYAEMFNNDKEIFRANHPETWARSNVAVIRGKLAIQIYVGNQDPGLAGNRHLHALLDELEIPHGYQEFEGIAHNLKLLAEKVTTGNFEIAARSFSKAGR